MKTNILQEADALVNGQRQDDYGNVSDNFNQIAKLWSAVLEKEVTAQQVALCMVQVKIARQLHKPKRDNLVDGAGYLACIEKMEIEKEALSEQKDSHINQMGLPLMHLSWDHSYYIRAVYGLGATSVDVYEVTDSSGTMLFRGTRQDCKDYIDKVTNNFF